MAVFVDIPAANPLLTNWAVGAVPQDLAFIDRIAPVQTVGSRSGRYTVYDLPLEEVQDRIEGETNPWPQIRYGASEATFTIDAHGVEHPVPRLQSAGEYNAQRRNGVFLTQRQVQFNKVKTYLTFLSDAANYGTYTGSPAAKFNTDTTNIRSYFRTTGRVQGLGVRRNVAVMGVDVFDAIIANALFRGTFQGFQLMPAEQPALEKFVAAHLGLEDLIVLDLAYNSAAPGQAASYSDVWPAETVALYYRGPLAVAAGGGVATDAAGRPLIEEATPSFIRQIVWTGVPGAPTGIAAWETEDAMPGFGVTRIRSAQLYAPPAIQMARAGYLMTNVLA